MVDSEAQRHMPNSYFQDVRKTIAMASPSPVLAQSVRPDTRGVNFEVVSQIGRIQAVPNALQSASSVQCQRTPTIAFWTTQKSTFGLNTEIKVQAKR
jgi:hypothetical protein